METDKNITKLMEMLDHPETYSDRQIREIIARDEACRSLYGTMVETRQSYRHAHAAETDDAATEVAWQQFSRQHFPVRQHFSRRRAAAVTVGFILLAGLSFAAIRHFAGQRKETYRQEIAEPERHSGVGKAASVPQQKQKTAPAEPKTFDNIELELILREVSAHYGLKPAVFRDEALRHLRFYLNWDPQEPVSRIVNVLNHYERIQVTLADDHFTVE